jgi:hypothetical protein
MSTFRNQQIQEILNYDRSMNRRVLDNEISQVTHFNDERSPPSNRDIKFEAIMGTLVDGLKAKIAEALTSIASKQYPKITSSNATRLLSLGNGDKEGKYKDMNVGQFKKALRQQQDYDKAMLTVKKAEQVGKDIQDEKKDDEDNEEGLKPIKNGQEAEDATAPENADSVPAGNFLAQAQLEEQHRTTPGLQAVFGSKTGLGKPKIRKFNTKPKKEVEEDRTNLEGEKSKTQTTNATENILYEIITMYNGIVDKVLQNTQPDGRFASKRNVSQASIGYLADVLKGVLDPLKHLVFELSQVRVPSLASSINMMASMVELIDVAPPFQKVNISAYKTGMPDFQGLSGETEILNADGYLSDLKDYKEKIQAMFNQAEHQSRSILFNLKDDKLKASLMKSINDKKQRLGEIIESIKVEMRNVEDAKVLNQELKTNSSLIKKAQNLYSDIQELLQNGPDEKKQYVEVFGNMQGEIPKTPDESNMNYLLKLINAIKQIQDQLDVYEAYRHEHDLAEGDDTDLDNQESNFTQQKNKIENSISALLGIDIPLDEFMEGNDLSYDDLVGYLGKESNQPSIDFTTPGLQSVFGKSEKKEEKQLLQQAQQLEQKGANNEEYTTPGLQAVFGKKKYTTPGLQQAMEGDNDETGSGNPMADIAHTLHKVGYGGISRQLMKIAGDNQYWHHRKLTDDDKAHNELIKRNEKWQAVSNPPHTNPIGNLYPFYKKDKASLYSFPLKLKSELAVLKPDDTQKTARGADVSLLQGPIGAPAPQEKMRPRMKASVTHRTAKEAMDNILEGRGKGKKNSKGLHKLLFNDEDNDMFDEEMDDGPQGGMIEEEEPEDEDRFRNKKLGPMKKNNKK